MTKHRHIWISTRTTGAERSDPDLLQRPRDGHPIGAGSHRRYSYLPRSGPSVAKRGVHSLVARCVGLLRGETTSVAHIALGDARIDLCASTHRRRQAAAVSGNAPCQCAMYRNHPSRVLCPGRYSVRPQCPTVLEWHASCTARFLAYQQSDRLVAPYSLSVARPVSFAAATPNPQAGNLLDYAGTLIGAMRARWPMVRSNKAITSSCVVSGSSFSDIRRILAGRSLHLVMDAASGAICLIISRASFFSVRFGIGSCGSHMPTTAQLRGSGGPRLGNGLAPTTCGRRYDFEHPSAIRCRQMASDKGCQMASGLGDHIAPATLRGWREGIKSRVGDGGPELRQVTAASHHAVNNAIGKATVSSDRRPLPDD